MNFYLNNFEQDRLYLEISTKYNLAYWIAADIDHFITNFPELVSEADGSKINKQYSTALKILKDAKKLSSSLTGKHKDSEIVLQKYVDFVIKAFDPNKEQTLNDSESNEVYLMNGINAEEEFRNNFKKFLSGNDIELYLLISHSYFAKALLSMINFYEMTEVNNSYKLSNPSKDIVDNFEMARSILGEGMINDDWIDGVINDFVIIGSKDLSTNAMANYCNINIEYVNLWKEFYYVYAEYYKDFIERDYQFDQLEFDVMSHESTKYQGKINIIAYEISMMILSYMDKEIQKVELFTPRTIKSLTNKLEKRYVR